MFSVVYAENGRQAAEDRTFSMSQSLFLMAFLTHFRYSFSLFQGFPGFFSSQSHTLARLSRDSCVQVGLEGDKDESGEVVAEGSPDGSEDGFGVENGMQPEK